MDAVFLKQIKPLKVKIFGYSIIFILAFMLYSNEVKIIQGMILCVIAFLLIEYSISYEINKGFNNFKHYKLFGFTVFKSKFELDFPDYISVFSASFKLDNDWGAVSAMGTKEQHGSIVIKFFKGNKNQIVFKSEDYQLVLEKANELGKMLNVKVHDKVKQ